MQVETNFIRRNATSGLQQCIRSLSPATTMLAATVKTTEEGAANNRFVVAAPDGCGPEKIKAALLRIAE